MAKNERKRRKEKSVLVWGELMHFYCISIDFQDQNDIQTDE